MGRSSYSAGKRQREADKARKKREKADRLRRNRETGGGGIPIASVEEIQSAAMVGDEPANPNGSDGETVDVSSPNSRPRPGRPVRLFVGSLSWDTTAESLKTFFSSLGDVVDAIVVTDRDTGDSRGFGFVTMADKKAAATAVRDLDGQELDGRSIRVSVATERR